MERLLEVGFDESGNTGQNLLDPDQPVFVLASVLVGPQELRELRDSLGIGPNAELHFAQLRRSKRAWQRIVESANLPWIDDAAVKAVIYHKRFMIVTKIVDMLLEAFLHEAGIDLYVQGRNIGISNLWYHAMPVFCNPARFEEVLENFVRMVRNPSDESIRCFYNSVWELRRSCDHREFRRDDLAMLLQTQEIVMGAVLDDPTAVDPAVPAFLHAAVGWDEQLDHPFRILHDVSKPIAHSRQILESFWAEDEPRVLSGYDRRQTRFPVRVEGFRFAESKDEPLIQAADFVAGCVGYIFRAMADSAFCDDLSEGLRESRLAALDHALIWPSTAVTPEELGTEEIGGINPADHGAELITRQRAKRRKESQRGSQDS